jgi:hypothetical protein
MPLAGIRLVRQHFADQLPPGYSLKDGIMDYRAGADGQGQWQVLRFSVIDPGGKVHDVTIEAPARDDINELAIAAARKFLKEVPQDEPSQPASGSTANEPPHGVDKADG